jgi:hypothetical protein
MAPVTLRHRKTDSVADWSQAELDRHIQNGVYPSGTLLEDIVLPSDWNDDHEMTEVNAAFDDAAAFTMMMMGA